MRMAAIPSTQTYRSLKLGGTKSIVVCIAEPGDPHSTAQLPGWPGWFSLLLLFSPGPASKRASGRGEAIEGVPQGRYETAEPRPPGLPKR
jgi:hypothetical protein